MTVANVASRVVYTGTGSLAAYAVSKDGTYIPFAANSHIKVKRLNTDDTVDTLVEGTDYTLTGGPTTGLVTLLLGNLASGAKLAIYRDETLDQDTDFGVADLFSSDTHDAVNDKSRRLDQQQQDVIDRALKLSRFASSSAATEVPDGSESGILGIGDDGGLVVLDPAEVDGLSGALGVRPIAQGGTGATTEAGARENLGVEIGVDVQAYNGELDGISALASTGLVARTANDTYTARTLAAGDASIEVTNGDGVSGAPSIKVPDNAITLAKMAHGTANTYLGFDADGVPAEIASLDTVEIDLLGSTTSWGGGMVRYWVRNGNELWAAGDSARKMNGYGIDTATPQRIAFNTTPNTITKVVSSQASTYVLDSDGRVYSFGDNSQGQLGHNDTTSRDIATRIEWFVSNTVTISDIFASGDGTTGAGTNHCVFFKTSAGTLYACGDNSAGQLGLGDTTDRDEPTVVTSVTGVASVALSGCNNPHTLAITTGGALYACGLNNHGQLGDGTTTTRNAFVLISAVTGCAQVIACQSYNTATHYGFSLVRTSGGDVYSCGYNGHGQLGHGDTTSRSAFTKISALSSVSSIVATSEGYFGIVAALTSAGQLYAWGYNGAGAVGDGTTTSPVSTPYATLSGVASAYVSGINGSTGIHALKSDGTLWATGYNGQGNLGIGSASNVSTWTQCAGVNGTISTFRTAGGTTLWGGTILYSDGRTAVCGDNSQGQLGLGTGTTDATMFYDVGLLTQKGVTGAAGAGYAAASTSSLAIGTGSKAFTVASGLAYSAGARIRAASAADPTVDYMEGVVTAYSGTTLTVTIDLAQGSGTHADWTINLAGDQGASGVVWEGAWQTSTAYVVGDSVSNSGSAYICTSNHTSGASTEPGTGASWATVWDVLAAKGDQGDAGTNGTNGTTVPDISGLTDLPITSLDRVTDELIVYDDSAGGHKKFFIPQLVLDVTHPTFGAVGNDSTSNTTALQAAIDHVESLGGGTLYIPKGTYRTGALTVTGDNITLQGDPGAILSFPTLGSGVNGIEVTGDNFSIFDIEAKGPAGAAYVRDENFIYVYGADTDNRVSRFRAERCTVYHFGFAGFLGKFVNDFHVHHSHVHDCGYFGIAYVSCNQVRVQNNHVYTITPGTSSNMYGISGTHDTTNYHLDANAGQPSADNPFCNDCVISFNTIEDIAWEGIDFHGAYNSQVSFNRVFATKYGIAVTGSSGDAAPYAGYQNLVIGNIVDGRNIDGSTSGRENTGYGINVNGGTTNAGQVVVCASNLVAYKGVVDNPNTGAIQATFPWLCNVYGNVVDRWKGVAILLTQGKGACYGNTIGEHEGDNASDTYAYAIYDQSTSGEWQVFGNVLEPLTGYTANVGIAQNSGGAMQTFGNRMAAAVTPYSNVGAYTVPTFGYTNPIGVPAGAVGAVGLYIGADADTGWYSTATDKVALALGGAQKALFEVGGPTFTNTAGAINSYYKSSGSSSGFRFSVDTSGNVLFYMDDSKFMIFGTAGTARAYIGSSGNFNLYSGNAYQINATQVVTARQTGWTNAATGTLNRATALDGTWAQAVGGTYTQAEVEAIEEQVKFLTQKLAALETDLRTHGLIGA